MVTASDHRDPRRCAAPARANPSRPTLLFLDYGRPVNTGDDQLYALARATGFRTFVAPYAAVYPGRGGIWLTHGFEELGGGRRRITQWECISPWVLFHRVHMSPPRERIFAELARAHPQALVSYHPALGDVRTKWGAELAFRRGARNGVDVRRPETFLFRKHELFKLRDVGRRHPLIFKPSEGSQGRGILLSTPQTFDSVVGAARAAPTTHFVVQRLVDDGVRLDGRTLDLRVYALVRSFQPLSFSLFRDGIVRVAARPLEMDRSIDPLAVLTNCTYRRSRDGCVQNLTIPELMDRLESIGHDVSDLWERIETQARNVFTCFAHALRMSAFEMSRLFFVSGLDLMLGYGADGLEPIFLESNYTPLLHDFGPEAVDDGLRTTTKQWLAEVYERCSERRDVPSAGSQTIASR